MGTTRIAPASIPWSGATELYGPAAIHLGKPIFEVKLLSDRRAEGGGIAYLLKTTPPPGKLVKIVAVARSDEHIFNFTGGACTKSGRRLGASGGYALNSKGQPHSAFIGEETVSLVVYAGAPDEIKSIESRTPQGAPLIWCRQVALHLAVAVIMSAEVAGPADRSALTGRRHAPRATSVSGLRSVRA